MNKQEAARILQDILAIWTDDTVHSYSIDKVKDQYEIRIFLPAYLRKLDFKSVGPMLTKQGLAIKESESSLVIYHPTENTHLDEINKCINP
jgi:hypothetical protein